MSSEHVSRKREANKARIVQAALEVFSAQGFETTTMVNVAEKLGMTGPSIYHYFPTKDALLFECIHTTLSQLYEALTAAASATDPVLAIDALVRAQAAFELEVAAVAPLVNSQLYGPAYLTAVLDEERREVLRKMQRDIVGIYRRTIEAGVAAGAFDVEDLSITVFNLLALSQYIGVWFKPGTKRRQRDVLRQQSDAALRLLGASAEVRARLRG